MSVSEQEEDRRYTVLVNHEEQYSLWPKDVKIPAGWTQAREEGSKIDCLQFVDEVWTDLRPLSLRKRMAEHVEN
jgi:MbtH protein